jgi:hypothetical protein
MLGQGVRQPLAGRAVDRFGEIDAGNLGANRRRERGYREFGYCILGARRLSPGS